MKINKIKIGKVLLKIKGTIVAVVGLYDKGKTFVLNSLTK